METLTKYPKLVVSSIALVIFFIMANLSFANLVTFEEEYTYQASEYDSKFSCKALALEQLKRLLLEKLGTYLESQTEVRNFRLTKDQIVVLSAGIVKTEIIDERWDGVVFYLKAKIQADPGEIAKSIESLHQDRQKTRELEKIKKQADELLKEAERLRNELKVAGAGKSERARKDYDETVKRLSAVDLVTIGTSFYLSASYKDAIDAFDKAIKLDRQYAEAYLHRAMAYDMLGQSWQGIKDSDKAIELNRKFGMAYFVRGVCYYGLKKYPPAISNFDKAIGLEPNFAGAYNMRGLAYRGFGNYEQAFMNFDKAIEAIELRTDSHSLPRHLPFYNRGLAFMDLDDKQKAIRDFSKAIELNPKVALEAYDYRSLIYLALGKWQEAIGDLDMYIKLNPKNSNIYIRRSFAYIALGDMTQASWDAYTRLGDLRRAKGDWDKASESYRQAIRDCDKGIELNPKSVSSYYNRGLCYLNLKDYRQAIEDFNKTIELNPKKGDAYHNLGLAYRRLGDHQEGNKNIQIAAKLGSSEAQKFLNGELSVDYWLKKGTEYLGSKKYKDAITAISKAIELAPDFGEAYAMRGFTYVTIGDKEKAREDLKTAAKLGVEQAQDALKSAGVKWEP